MIKSRTSSSACTTFHSKTPGGSSRPTVHTTHHHREDDQKHVKRQQQKQKKQLLVFLLEMLSVLMIIILILVWFRLGQRTRVQHSLRSSSSGGEWNILPQEEEDDISIESLFKKLRQLDDAIERNQKLDHPPFVHPNLLLSLNKNRPNLFLERLPSVPPTQLGFHGPFFRISRYKVKMDWQAEWKQLQLQSSRTKPGSMVDYTDSDLYVYPSKLPLLHQGPETDYPKLKPLMELFTDWPQDDMNHPPMPIQETLLHFDYKAELLLAKKFQKETNYKVPFKMTNVPEILQANAKWTDDYVARQFDVKHAAHGNCEESRTHFFSYFIEALWNIQEMGGILPPTRKNDWTFQDWSQHAKYADTVQLDPYQPHFYWQAGVPREERYYVPFEDWSFISKDLPSFSGVNATFLSPSPQDQQGIQCRFGERGVTAATHFDRDKNMVGMITGAKRYILSPPNQCRHLGIVTKMHSALFRHSMLNFGNFQHMNHPNMSDLERDVLQKAGQALSVETVLKAGEVLYIPSYWFHYIISLTKSAQCNVRSGVDLEPNTQFGDQRSVNSDQCNPTLE